MKQLLQIVVNEVEEGTYFAKVGHNDVVTTSKEYKNIETALQHAITEHPDAEELAGYLGWESE